KAGTRPPSACSSFRSRSTGAERSPTRSPHGAQRNARPPARSWGRAALQLRSAPDAVEGGRHEAKTALTGEAPPVPSTIMFVAMHESGFGTKRTYRDDLLLVRLRGKADISERVRALQRHALEQLTTPVARKAIRQSGPALSKC